MLRYNSLNKIFCNNNMSGCIKYPILFSGGDMNKIYDFELEKSKENGFKNIKNVKEESLFDSDFQKDCENFDKIPHI